MRTRVKIMDLNLRQWDYIQTKVPVGGREFLPGLPRLCAVFELAPQFPAPLHVEMDVAELAGLLAVLEGIKNEVAVVDIPGLSLAPDQGTEPDA